MSQAAELLQLMDDGLDSYNMDEGLNLPDSVMKEINLILEGSDGKLIIKSTKRMKIVLRQVIEILKREGVDKKITDKWDRNLDAMPNKKIPQEQIYFLILSFCCDVGVGGSNVQEFCKGIKK